MRTYTFGASWVNKEDYMDRLLFWFKNPIDIKGDDNKSIYRGFRCVTTSSSFLKRVK